MQAAICDDGFYATWYAVEQVCCYVEVDMSIFGQICRQDGQLCKLGLVHTMQQLQMRCSHLTQR